MPVQIPTLQRVDPAQDAPERTIEAKAPDATRAVQRITTATEGLMKEGIDQFVIKKQNESGRRIGNMISNQLSNWEHEQLNGTPPDPDGKGGILGIRHADGNPDRLYSDMDRRFTELKTKLLKEHNIGSEKSKEIANAIVNKTHSSLYNKRLIAYGSQKNKFDDKIVEETIAIHKRDALTDLLLVKPGSNKKFDFQPLDRRLLAMNQVRVDQAEEQNATVPGPNGSVKLNSITMQQIAEDTSETVQGFILNAISSNQLDIAEEAIKKYKQKMDPISLAKVTEKYHEALLERGSLEHLTQVKNLNRDKQKAYVEKIKDEGMRQEVKKRLVQDAKTTAELDKRNSERVFNVLALDIFNRQMTKHPYKDFDDIKKHPVYDKNKDALTFKQHEALKKAINQPKFSSTESMVRMMDHVVNGSLFGMSPERFIQEAAGLSESDFKVYRRHWEMYNQESTSEERSRLKNAQDIIYRHFSENGLVVISKKTQRESVRSMALRHAFINEVMQNADYFRHMTDQDVERRIKELVTDYVTRKNKGEESIFEKFIRSIPHGDKLFDDEDEKIPFVNPKIGPPRTTRQRTFDPRRRIKTKPPSVDPPPVTVPKTPKKTGAKKKKGKLKYTDLSSRQAIDFKKQFRAANPGEKLTRESLMKWVNDER